MIFYNIRKNGPYEYDKFVLNVGQIYNAVTKLQLSLPNPKLEENSNNISTIYETATSEQGIAANILIKVKQYM